MIKPNVKRNVAAASLEVLVISIVLFFLYRFLVDEVGIKMIGVWSLVLATTAFGNLAGFGFPRALVHFLPKLLKKGQRKLAVLYIETAMICIGIFIILLCLLLYYPLYHLLATVIDEPEMLAIGRELLPWALTSLVMVSLGDILMSSIKGLQLNFIASCIVIACNALYFMLSISLVPEYGIIAMAWAQMIQIACIMLLSFIVMRWQLGIPFFPYRISKRVFKRVTAYGFKAQYIAFIVMFLQPLTKYLLGYHSTLEMVGYYEFALKFVQNVGKMITNANNALTSTFSMHGKEQGKLRDLYQKANSVTWLVAPLMMGGLLAITPTVSELWIGNYVPAFYGFSLIIGIAQMLSVMCSPSYSMGMGAGVLYGNMVGQSIIGISNLVLGWVGGYYYGAYGVVFGAGAALILGNLFILFYNSKKVTGALPFSMRLGVRTLLVMVFMLFAIASSYITYLYWMQDASIWMKVIATGLTYGVIFIGPALFHPGFKEIMRNLKRKQKVV